MLKNNERSAEFYLGQREALRALLTRIGGKRNTMLATWGSYTATDVEAIIREELDILAAAEALEAGEKTVTPDWADAMAYGISGRVSPGVLTINDGMPTAAEVIEAAEKALLQVGQWDAFTQREKGLIKDALALIGDWKEANGGH